LTPGEERLSQQKTSRFNMVNINDIPWKYHMFWLVVSIPLKNMTSSVGMIIQFPTEWKVIKFHGSSHHQAVIINHH
jgi:hypothetical protein